MKAVRKPSMEPAGAWSKYLLILELFLAIFLAADLKFIGEIEHIGYQLSIYL